MNCRLYLYILFFINSTSAFASVCLNMIVKDEAPVILRSLASVKPIIDYWVIVDTGSSDGTQNLIREFMKDIPGELHERDWVNFEHNRNQALELTKGKGDYVLFIDADEVLSFSDEFELPLLDQDCYYIPIKFNSTSYTRLMLINNMLDWKWEGVLHEYITCIKANRCATLAGVTNIVYTDGHRSTDPYKYKKDAELLENALIDDPENARYRFYLAQSYKDNQNYAKALQNYKARISLKGWQEEVFWSMLQASLMQEFLEYPTSIVIDSYYKTYLYRSNRAEPLYRIAALHRKNTEYRAGYEIAYKGLLLDKPSDILFVEDWIYDWGLLLEFSICAYWIEEYNEALFSSLLLLKNINLPDSVRECVETNLYWIRLKL